MIYLASPYTHPVPEVQNQRFEAVCRRAAQMLRLGIHVFSPIAHTHPIAAYGLPKNWRFWESYDREILDMCSEVYVLMLDGWEDSVGVRAEIKMATDLGKKVTYIEDTYQ